MQQVDIANGCRAIDEHIRASGRDAAAVGAIQHKVGRIPREQIPCAGLLVNDPVVDNGTSHVGGLHIPASFTRRRIEAGHPPAQFRGQFETPILVTHEKHVVLLAQDEIRAENLLVDLPKQVAGFCVEGDEFAEGVAWVQDPEHLDAFLFRDHQGL